MREYKFHCNNNNDRLEQFVFVLGELCTHAHDTPLIATQTAHLLFVFLFVTQRLEQVFARGISMS